jgi:hypothetical protein
MFDALFRDEQRLRELYNALAGTNYGEEAEVSINTLQNVLFMKQRNDISFTVGGKLVVLIEHQSTVNENMPLRCLLYIARLYEKLIDKKTIYREGLVPIPVPEFYVAYNGSKPQPDYREIRLSEAFTVKEKPVNLELTVKVININQGHNPAILRRCDTLGMYAEFVGLVKKEMKPNMPKQKRAEVLQKVIDYCIDQGILKEFLEEHSSEVQNMLFTKWNWKDYEEVQMEEAEERGRAEGRAESEERIRQDQEQIRQDRERIRQLEEENRRLRG